jgi:hypothetical protein
MNLAEALTAVAFLREDGQFIAMGDHLQMPPILQHTWDQASRRDLARARPPSAPPPPLVPAVPMALASPARAPRRQAEHGLDRHRRLGEGRSTRGDSGGMPRETWGDCKAGGDGFKTLSGVVRSTDIPPLPARRPEARLNGRAEATQSKVPWRERAGAIGGESAASLRCRFRCRRMDLMTSAGVMAVMIHSAS